MPQDPNIVLRELNALLLIEGEECDDHDRSYGTAEVRRVRWTEDGCDLLLAVRPVLVEEYTAAFTIGCDSLSRIHLTDRRSSEQVELLDNHPLLFDSLQGTVQLAFLGRVRNPRAAAAAMFKAYEKYYKGWQKPTTQDVRRMAKQLDATGGLLTTAPPRLADRYAEILAEHGTDPYFFPPRMRGAPKVVKFMDGKAPRVLLIGESYVIGTGFYAERVPITRLYAP